MLPGSAVSPIDRKISYTAPGCRHGFVQLTSISIFRDRRLDLALINSSRILTQQRLPIPTRLEHARRIHSPLETISLPAENIVSMGRVACPIAHAPLQ